MASVNIAWWGLLCIGALQMALGHQDEYYSFEVAEVKPHYGCTEPSGQQRVRDFIDHLASKKLSIITLLQVEFEMNHPEGYFAIGGACAGSEHADVAVALVREDEFAFAAPLGATLHGWGNMPFLSGTPFQPTTDAAHSMCISSINVVGERPYAGAILTHKATGVTLCLVIGTMPHPSAFPKSFTMDFVDAVQSCTEDRPLLLVVDSNLVYGQTVSESFSEQGLDLKQCSDPGAWGEPTCCNDSFAGHPESRYQSDRTVLCGGHGKVTDFTVEKNYICHAAKEHLTTTSRVKLLEAVPQKREEENDSPLAMRVPFPHIYGFSASIFCLAWCYWIWDSCRRRTEEAPDSARPLLNLRAPPQDP